MQTTKNKETPLKKFLSIFAAIVLTASLASAAGVNYGNTAVVSTDIALSVSSAPCTNAIPYRVTSGSGTNGSWNTVLTAGSVALTRLELVIQNTNAFSIQIFNAPTNSAATCVAVVTNGASWTVRYPFLDSTEYFAANVSLAGAGSTGVTNAMPLVGFERWGRIQ